MTSFDRIASSVPLNRTAAVVTGKGESWTPAVVLEDYFEDMPPLAAKVENDSPEYRDFTGFKTGRLTVFGRMAKDNPKASTSWVCRCVCGGFCTRSTKAMKAAEAGAGNFVDRCGKCHYERRLRSGWAPDLKAPPRFTAGSRNARKKLCLKGGSQ